MGEWHVRAGRDKLLNASCRARYWAPGTSIMLNDPRSRDKHIVKEEKEEAERQAKGTRRSGGHHSGRGEAGCCPLGEGGDDYCPPHRCTTITARKTKPAG